jgi:hypothetical protein
LTIDQESVDELTMGAATAIPDVTVQGSLSDRRLKDHVAPAPPGQTLERVVGLAL